MIVEMIGWAKIPGDKNDWASKLTYAFIETGHRSAKFIALHIDGGGKKYTGPFGAEFPPAPGHGITVVYPSGKTRTFYR